MIAAPQKDRAALLVTAEGLLAQRRLPEALACFHTAESAGTDADRCAAGRWMAHMLSGQFEQAWQESDAIRARGNPDPHRFWQGEVLTGKRVILRCLHGFGDAVQFLRYVPRLRAIASHLIVEVPPRFLELAPHFDGVDEAITWGAQAPAQPPTWDVQIELMELPYIFRTELADLPLATGYLHLPTSSPTTTKSSRRLQVGIASTAGSWNPTRAIPTELLQPIMAAEDCDLWDLSGGPDARRHGHPISPELNRDLRSENSIAGLAEIISKLDLVITVDTLAAHLAGALGIEAWVLLQHEADWRWMHARNDSPWYPSLRLFRQPAPGDWASVIASAGHALHARTSRHDDRQVA